MRTAATLLFIFSLCACSSPDDGTAGVGGSGATGGQAAGGQAAGGQSAGGEGGAGGDGGAMPGIDEQLRDVLAALDPPLSPWQPLEEPPAALVALGEALFFDPILSGNKDIACASCHHPAWATGDGLPLSVGTGGTGIGPVRANPGYPGFIPRHAQHLFNIGHVSFERMFWDGRVERLQDGSLSTPAGIDPLPGLASPLAAQALMPVLDRAEMRGQPGDTTVTNETNELAVIDDNDPVAVWDALMTRLNAIAGYQALFVAAYGDAPWTFAHAANALAAYQTAAFATQPTPWDAYLGGDDTAIEEAAKLGALLFYTSAGCGNCHSGPLLTDHRFHATGVIQIGPGQADSAPYDLGRQHITNDVQGRFAFRTPSLRNVAQTAPYMHNGAYSDLGAVVKHYANPLNGSSSYDPTGLHEDLLGTVQTSPDHVADLNAHLSEDLVTTPLFAGLSNLRLFLEALTDPNVTTLPMTAPTQTVSGLPLP